MADERHPFTNRFSRRSLIFRTAGIAGAAALLTGAAHRAEAEIKISQKAVAYQDHPDGEKRCDKCTHFQPPNGCKVVDGAVNPQGYCKLFVQGRQAG